MIAHEGKAMFSPEGQQDENIVNSTKTAFLPP